MKDLKLIGVPNDLVPENLRDVVLYMNPSYDEHLLAIKEGRRPNHQYIKMTTAQLRHLQELLNLAEEQGNLHAT